MALGLLSAEFSREKAGVGISIQYISSSPLRRKAAGRSDGIDGMRHPEDFFFFNSGCVYRGGKKVPSLSRQRLSCQHRLCQR